jgi:hypothetical protein
MILELLCEYSLDVCRIDDGYDVELNDCIRKRVGSGFDTPNRAFKTVLCFDRRSTRFQQSRSDDALTLR